jgi:hypothetical protein
MRLSTNIYDVTDIELTLARELTASDGQRLGFVTTLRMRTPEGEYDISMFSETPITLMTKGA